MSLFLVAYDLNEVGQNYECISQKLESLGTYWHIQGSVWLVEWDGNPYALATHLEACLDSNDKLFVTRVSRDSAWSGYDHQASDWLNSHL